MICFVTKLVKALAKLVAELMMAKLMMVKLMVKQAKLLVILMMRLRLAKALVKLMMKVLVMAEAAGTAVQHAVECMALGGPALVMSAHSAASAGVDDIINATNALVYRTGDLEGLGLLLDQLLSDAHVDEEPGVEGGGAGGSSGRVWRCELQQRACEDACMRHGMVYKVATMIRSEHASAQELGEKARQLGCVGYYLSLSLSLSLTHTHTHTHSGRSHSGRSQVDGRDKQRSRGT